MKRDFFGTDGIRDVAGQGRLAPDQVVAYGQALGAWLSLSRSPSRVLIGRDTRASGPVLLEQLRTGIQAGGHVLVDGGILPTPAVQTLSREEGFDLAVVISASHNPAEDNGLKFFGADGRKLSDDAEIMLEALTNSALQQRLESFVGVPGPLIKDAEAGTRYLDFLCDVCFPHLDLQGTRIVLDCAHGAGYLTAPEALRRLGAEVTLCGCSPDGANINVAAGVFHVAALGPTVLNQGAALGLALDGDADRVLLVDERGEVRDGDHMLGVLASQSKARGQLPGDCLITTVMANLGLKVYLKELGISCEMVPVGDRFVAARMAETSAVLGGEQSGHILFRSGERWFGDGLYTALRILEIMHDTGEPFSALAKGIEKFPQVLLNVRVGEKPPVERVRELWQAKVAAEVELGDEGRVVLRYSGTEPLLRVMVEGRNLHQVESLARKMTAIAERVLGPWSGAA